MPDRVMFVQLKTGHDIDQGPAWISLVRFNRTWKTATWHGKTLRRSPGMFDANFYDVETDEEHWISGPHRDRRDPRYSSVKPTTTTMPASPTKRFSTAPRCRVESADERPLMPRVVRGVPLRDRLPGGARRINRDLAEARSC